MARYDVGIVGCGHVGKLYARWFQSLDCRVAACADPNLEKAEALAVETGAKAFRSHEEMLGSVPLDLVAVCTWPSYHHPVTVDGARAGLKGIICEKPLAANLREADEMIATCEANGVKLVTGHQHRFAPWIRCARELIRSGAVGEVELIWGHCSLDLMNNGTHVIDTIHALNQDQPVEWAAAHVDCSSKVFGRGNHPDMYAEDMSVVRIHYANGVEALIELGTRARQDFGFRVLGAQGVIYLEKRAVRYVDGKTGAWITPELEPGQNGREKVEDLLRAVDEDTVPESSGQKGRAALEVIAAAFESVRTRRVVEFPVSPDAPTLKDLVEAGVFGA